MDGHPGSHDGEETHGRHPMGSFDQRPLVVTWETTQACGLACDHCRADANRGRHPDELTTEEAFALFEQVRNFGDPPPFFVLSGGDPLERPDLFELLDGARDRGLSPSITPATTSNLDGAMIDRLAEAGVNRVAVSIDGSTADTHDAFRGEEGSFDTAIAAAEHARSQGLTIQFNTTVTAKTVAELPAIADLADSLEVAMWEVFFLIPIGRGTELEQLSPQQAGDVANWLYTTSQDAPYRVITVEAPFYRRVAAEVQRWRGETPRPVGSTGAGNGFVFVSHTGEVYPSGFLPLAGGNVRDESLVSIYRDSDLFTDLRDPSSLRGPCGSCQMASACGGSRSRAYATTGDPLDSDPLCPYAES